MDNERDTITLSTGDKSVTMSPAELEALASGDFLYRLPKADTLFVDGAKLAPAPDLDVIVGHLINKHDEHGALREFHIKVLWRDGEPDWLGHAKPKGEEDRLLSGVDAVILIAWQQCRAFKITAHQMEALLYHELCHFEINEDEKGRRTLKGRKFHDIEEFHAVIAKYGDWRHDVKAMDQQLAMHLEIEGEAD